MDSGLNFEQHIQTQMNKANMMVGIIRRSFKFMDMETFRLLFKALAALRIRQQCLESIQETRREYRKYQAKSS
jgi:hypothetical protein